jgi:hypothetical protein
MYFFGYQSVYFEAHLLIEKEVILSVGNFRTILSPLGTSLQITINEI